MLLAAGATLVWTAAAGADGVRITGAPRPLPAGNDFVRHLPPVLMEDVSLLLTERSRLTFTAVAAESGNDNTLVVEGLGTLTERRDFGFRRRGRDRISGIFDAGPLDPLLMFTSSGGDSARPGDAGFGVFADGPPGQEFSTFYLVRDDAWVVGEDGDFDDYVIRVDVEPLP